MTEYDDISKSVLADNIIKIILNSPQHPTTLNSAPHDTLSSWISLVSALFPNGTKHYPISWDQAFISVQGLHGFLVQQCTEFLNTFHNIIINGALPVLYDELYILHRRPRSIIDQYLDDKQLGG